MQYCHCVDVNATYLCLEVEEYFWTRESVYPSNQQKELAVNPRQAKIKRKENASYCC